MLSYLKQPYICPEIKVVSLVVYTPLMQPSFGGINESPVTGESIGDDE